MAKKNKELPVLVLLEIPKWKNNILQVACKLLRLPGFAMLITVESPNLVYDGKNYKWQE